MVALAALAGCTVERAVLDDPLGVVTSCEEAWEAGQSGVPCAFDGACDRPTPWDPSCCTDFAYCTDDGELVTSFNCVPDCGCQSDFECDYGLSFCEELRCMACPSTELCGDCDPGWQRLTRNGCETCLCAPPSECAMPGYPCDDQGVEYCAVGAACAPGCDPYADPGCCANVCATPGCPEPAPLGCWTDCPVELGCSICATAWCECDGERWVCEAQCVEGSFEPQCTYP